MGERDEMACNGISTDDFSQIATDFERTVSYEVVTKTLDGLGEETSTYATAADKDVIFFLEENKWAFDKEGLIEKGDAYILAPTSEAIARYDKFTISGETFIIQKVVNRYVMNVAMVDLGVCFKI